MIFYKKTYFMLLFTFLFVLTVGLDKSFSKSSTQEYWPTKEWKISKPEAQGMDSNRLDKMNQHIEDNCSMVRSMLIIRNGYIVFEKYYKEDVDYVQPVYSVTKSVISALVGIALEKGNIKSLDQKMFTFFPEFASDITDPRLKEITIRNLLEMSAGFPTAFQAGDMKASFTQSIVTDPGSHSAYNSGDTNLLSGIISKTTKMNSLEFGNEYLFGPLGIEEIFWGSSLDGYTMGGYGLNMRPRDMAKIGYLYLKNGHWDGKQIVPEKWIKESTQKQATIFIGSKERPYGYLWWITSPDGHPGYCAIGIGGQYIHVVPDLNIVMVATSTSMGINPEHQGLMPSFIVPAVLK